MIRPRRTAPTAPLKATPGHTGRTDRATQGPPDRATRILAALKKNLVTDFVKTFPRRNFAYT